MKDITKPIIIWLKRYDKLFFIIAFIMLLIIRIWLITGIPKMIIYGPHDDLYFAKAANYILHGHWMGPYTQMTLIKTPFYAFFLVLSFFTGLPLFLDETLFYAGACIILFFAFIPLVNNQWLRLLLFSILLYSPASFVTDMNLRVYREFVYSSLTLYIVAFAIGFFLRLNKKLSYLITWSIGLGLSMGAFMLTREEGIWIYPIFFSILISCLLIIWLIKYDQRIKRSLLVLLPILILYIPILGVSYLNYSYYGFWGTSENLDPDFNRVINTLARIKTSGMWHPAIQIPQEARMKAYEASPILDEMKDEIENSVVDWNIYDDETMEAKPEWYLSQFSDGGSEIGAHFMWLFRDAVASNGYYSRGRFPSDFYKQLADQLETACNDGKLKCSSPSIIPTVGSIERKHYPIILRMFTEDLLGLLRLDYSRINNLDVKNWPAWLKSRNDNMYFENIINNPIDTIAIHSSQNNQGVIKRKTELPLKLLSSKAGLMGKIFDLYRRCTLTMFLFAFFTWIVHVILVPLRKEKGNYLQFLIISSFTLGLFVTRMMTLTIVDATTSISGVPTYGISNYIFVYSFILIIIFWIFDQAKNMNRVKAISNKL